VAKSATTFRQETRKELVGSARVALLDGRQDVRDVVQG
jgi:hypothetical protein